MSDTSVKEEDDVLFIRFASAQQLFQLMATADINDRIRFNAKNDKEKQENTVRRKIDNAKERGSPW